MMHFIGTVAVLCTVSPLVTASNEDASSPVTKIVGLIQELKAKIVADGKAEQNMYNKYACWCETTSARKAKDIHEAHASIKSLAAKILELKSTVTGLKNELNHLSKQIQENQQAQDTATTIRTKENTAYLAEKTELETTLNSLERGIKVLSGAGTKTALLQKVDEMKPLAQAIHKVVDKMPNIDHLLTPKQLKLIKTFATDPAEFYDQKAEKAASYNPASATIQGILKDMYDSFSANLEKGAETEAVAYKNFETLMGAKANEMATFQDERTKREMKKAAAEEEQAQTSAAYDETVKVVKQDTLFFDDTKAACTAKADEWSERVRARTEELAGVDKALEILTGDDAKALFNKAIKPGMETFLQIDSDANAPRSKAIEALKKGAARSKSLRLMAIAASIKAGGHFDAVTGEIEKMMANIKDEERADIRQKDWCKDEIHKNEQEAARYEYKVAKKDAHIGRLKAKLEEMEATLVNTVKQIMDTKQDMKQMEDSRKAEHAEYKEAKTDDEGAVALLGQAIESLGSFYKNNFLQEPVFERSEDLAPDATFTSAGKSRGESKGILSIMTMLKEDLEDEITNAVKNEKENQFYFERSIRESHTLLKELKEKKSSLELNIADANTEIDNEFEEREDINDLWTKEKDYIGSIKPDCDYLFETFDDRRAKRNAETQSLIDAKGMLEGSDQANTGVSEEGKAMVAAADGEAPAEAPAEAGASFLQIQEHSPRMTFSLF